MQIASSKKLNILNVHIMNDQTEDNPNETDSNNLQILKNQCEPFSNLSTNQFLTSLYITEDGVIFVGTKYWFSIYCFSGTDNELKAKNHFSIGSRINHIDSKIFSQNDELRYVALATGDGFVNFLKIEFNQLSIFSHEKMSIFYGETKFVSIIDENTIVSAGDDRVISFISKDNSSWKHKQYQMKNKITALNYFSDRIFVGYQNGEVDIFESPKTESSEKILDDLVLKRIIELDGSILGFYKSRLLIVVTDEHYYELDQESTEKNKVSFSSKADKVSITFDHNDNNQTIQRMLVSDSNHVRIYENNQLSSTLNISSNEFTSMSFFGDSLAVASSNTISLYQINIFNQ